MPKPKKDVERQNGHLVNGHGRLDQDAQEFELEGLTSEDEAEMAEEERLLKREAARIS
jgi:hypothetical protein